MCVRRFKTSKNDHIIEVQLYDDIDFICPYYPAESSASASEFYTIYMVGGLFVLCTFFMQSPDIPSSPMTKQIVH